MSSRLRWGMILAACMLVLALLMEAPQLLRMRDPRYRGIPVHLNTDEYNYLPRVQEALSGRPEQAAEAVVGDPSPFPLQSALLEETWGVLFSWTGWRAATVMQVADAVVPPLLFLVLWFLFLSFGFTRAQALLGTILFIALNLYGFNRPIHQRDSFLLVVLAMLFLTRAWEGRRRIPALLGGILLGILVGVYFWSWTYAWAWWGLFLLWEGWEWLRTDHQQWSRSRWAILAAAGLLGAVVAFPFLRQMAEMARHPLYDVVQFRSGLYSSRRPEAWIRSTLFLGMVLGLWGALRQQGENARRYRSAFLAVVAAFLVLNQQVVHGKVLFFSSHYLFPLIFAGVVCFLLSVVLLMRSKTNVFLSLSLASSALFLAGIAWDGRYIIAQWTVKEGNFNEQHLAGLLPVLDALPRTRILSDQQTSLFIAGHTRHDVIYSFYLKNVMISDDEFAERSCMMRLLQKPENRDLERVGHLHQEMYGHTDDPQLKEKDIAFLTQTCRRLDEDPPGALRKYGVRYVLWNEAWEPQWDLARAKIPLEKVADGGWEGKQWSLWRL